MWFIDLYELGFKNVNHINPQKQRVCKAILDREEEFKDYCSKIVIFGSSTRVDCNWETSDLDVAVELLGDRNKSYSVISKMLREETDYNFDLFNINDLDETSDLFNNIKENGVVIYG